MLRVVQTSNAICYLCEFFDPTAKHEAEARIEEHQKKSDHKFTYIGQIQPFE